MRQIEENELRDIYRSEYWDAMNCGNLDPGLDLCVFDAAVNSGVQRARAWYAQAKEIDAFCDLRLTFLQRTWPSLARLWGGWSRRVAGIRNQAHLIAGNSVTVVPHDSSLHAGMKGDAVRRLQEKLRGLGYPCGAVDGIFGEQVFRAVVLFQHDNDLTGDPGVWLQPMTKSGCREANASQKSIGNCEGPRSSGRPAYKAHEFAPAHFGVAFRCERGGASDPGRKRDG